MGSLESFSACFCEKKKLKITCPFCMGYRLTKIKDLQNALISRLFGVFARLFFCTEQLYGFLRIIFSLVLRKKKLKITCQFCMGLRLTKMEDLQNALISRLFLHAVFCTELLYGLCRIIFSIFLRKKKVENNLLILKNQNGGFFAQKNSIGSVESLSACFCEKKSWK